MAPTARRGKKRASQRSKKTSETSKSSEANSLNESKPKKSKRADSAADGDAIDYDVIIVGAGPAGMFAAYELMHDFSVAVVDMGFDVMRRKCRIDDLGYCTNCAVCHIMCGVGGAGTFSDGILNLRPDVGGDIEALVGSEKEAWRLVNYVDEVFVKCGAPRKLYKIDEVKIEELKRKAAGSGITFLDIKQRHIGSDKSPAVIENFAKKLRKGKVAFLLNKTVEDLIITDGTCKGIVFEDGSRLRSRYVLLAIGRVGVGWLDNEIKKNHVDFDYLPIDVGVRVEVQSIIMDKIIDVSRDPKFHIRSKTYDDAVRTFCTNHNGFVVKENYNSFVGVNGHSMHQRKSSNTNFAFLVTIKLTEPIENTIEYGKSIARIATVIGGNKPIVQRLGDLRAGRRSTMERIDRNAFAPTFKDVTPGDISMVFPHRIVADLMEGLEKLNIVIPGVADDSTLLYAPEIKYYAIRPRLERTLEFKSLRNAFAAGDGLGLSRGIIGAAVTGVLAARGIKENAGVGYRKS